MTADYQGPKQCDFGLARLTSFAALEAAARRAGYSEAAITAGRRAAALGCTDAEVELAADEVREREEWSAERGGIDEPEAWVALRLEDGTLHKLLNEPETQHDRFGEWLPQPECGEQGVTMAHLFALLDATSRVAKERNCSQAGIYWCWVFHMCGGWSSGVERPRFWTHRNGREAPLPREGPRELEPTDHAKATHGRFKRLREAHRIALRAACRRRDQSIVRGSPVSAERAAAEVAKLERDARQVVLSDELQPEPLRKALAKRQRDDDQRSREGVDCGQLLCGCCLRNVEGSELLGRPCQKIRTVSGGSLELELVPCVW